MIRTLLVAAVVVTAIVTGALCAAPRQASDFEWRSDLDGAIALAAKEKKPILLVFR